MQKLTENATHDNLTNEEYIEICDEIRGYNEQTGEKGMSWDKFIFLVGSNRFRSQWSEWRKGERIIQWDMMNDLRKAVSLPLLPEPTQMILERMVCPDALIETDVTEGQGKYVYIAKENPHTQPVFSNEEVAAMYTGIPTRIPTGNRRKARVGVMRPSHVPVKYDEQRKKLGKSWAEVVQAGLESIERGDLNGKQGKGGRLNGH